jgi:hypothetical protein
MCTRILFGHGYGTLDRTRTASTVASYPLTPLAVAIYVILGVLSFWDAVVAR